MMVLRNPELWKCIQLNRGQICLNMFLTFLIGATVSVAQYSDAHIAGTGKKYLYAVPSSIVNTSFLISYGLSKAISNLIVGNWADMRGRREPHIAGWVIGLILPVTVILAKQWGLIAAANLFLGIQQGLCWSTAIFMIVDYAGKASAGLAAGLNETIGYSSIAIFSLVAARVVDVEEKNYQRDPYYLVLALMATGLLSSLFFLSDTLPLVRARTAGSHRGEENEPSLPFKQVFLRVSWRQKDMALLCFAGMCTNFTTGLVWGLFTKWMIGGEPGRWAFTQPQIANVLFMYSFLKGISQFIAGYVSDSLGSRKGVITFGFSLCAFSLLWLGLAGKLGHGDHVFVYFMVGASGLGLGTGVVYPNLLAAISDHAAPVWRAQGLGIYRFWRDLGYAVGGLLGGGIQDLGHSYAGTMFFGVSVLLFCAIILPCRYEDAADSKTLADVTLMTAQGDGIETLPQAGGLKESVLDVADHPLSDDFEHEIE
eukprot:gb/GEZN01006771.1/.p1 GENE.gb/GEZN01006771.1/~~gb/GEZN01006771.1/.p1  ORF type:complete len:482 (-),score=35.01 gb/GEZN01006771.1/:77-1522(-)